MEEAFNELNQEIKETNLILKKLLAIELLRIDKINSSRNVEERLEKLTQQLADIIKNNNL